VCLEWKEIYNLPFKVLNDTKSRECQYKILNRYLTTNAFLHKIGLIASPLCTFCGAESDSLEHLLITCPFTDVFWLDFIGWCRNVNVSAMYKCKCKCKYNISIVSSVSVCVHVNKIAFHLKKKRKKKFAK